MVNLSKDYSSIDLSVHFSVYKRETMNRYEIALGKPPPVNYRLKQKFYNHKLLNALCETGKDPLIGDMELFEKFEGTDLSFWYKCLSNEEPNELGKMIMNLRDGELYMRNIDKTFIDRMRRAVG
jgi:hypothetical protein